MVAINRFYGSNWSPKSWRRSLEPGQLLRVRILSIEKSLQFGFERKSDHFQKSTWPTYLSTTFFVIFTASHYVFILSHIFVACSYVF